MAKRNVKATKKTFGEYKCKFCSKVFTENSGLAHHIQLHKTDRPFSCDLCSHTCKTKKYLTKHVKNVHQAATEHECSYCDRKFHYKSLLDQHMYIHTDARPYKCDVCGKGFNTSYSLNTHKYIHSDLKPFKCKYCDYACRDNSTLRKHVERHMGISRRYQCKMCDKSYKTKSVLKDHISEAHLDLEVKNSPCEECGKMFKSIKALSTHIKLVHKKIYSCKCDICGVEISNKYNMANHLTKHIHIKPFKCDFDGCTKRFKDKGTLKKHNIIHYPDKHLACNLCERRFTRTNRLKVHMKQHQLREKCVICDYCGTSFYNKNYLRNHITKKHCVREKFICDHCGLISYNKPSIVMHIKYGHGSEDDRQCKICKKTFKLHKYLKQHYLNTHCIKYNMAPRKPKPKRQKLAIKEEPTETKQMELMHEVKVEPISDSEQDARVENYSDNVYTDVSSVRCEKTNRRSVRFEDFFIEHIMKPNDNVRAQVKIRSIKGRQLEEMYKNLIIEEKIGKEESNEKTNENSLQDEIRVNNESNSLGDANSESSGKESNESREEIEHDKESTAKEDELNNDSNVNERIDQSNESNLLETIDQNNKSSANEVDGPHKSICKERIETSYGTNSRKVIGKIKTISEKEVNEQNHESNELDDDKNDTDEDNDVGNDNSDDPDYVDDDTNNDSVVDDETNDAKNDNDKSKQSKRIKINTHQCYVCFKLYETKDELIRHCQEHFDICNIKMLKKCPLCDYVTQLNLPRHMRLIHKINIKIPPSIKDRKNNNNGSRFYYNVDNDDIGEIELIPSVKNLNRRAYVELDKRRKEIDDRSIVKTKLVKKHGEWVVEKVKIDAKSSEIVVPELNGEDYLEKMKLLYRKAKNNGQKMLFPCNKCEKICQTLSALKLHSRKHDPNKKPFKKKVWKHKLSEEELKKIDEKPTFLNTNRYEKPKPIVNKHKCDPKLKEFYENNIKGGDIEFWHFLKIFNKMSRDDIKDFTDLENRKEYGMHVSSPVNESFDINSDAKIGKVKKARNAFRRKIMISRRDHQKRKAMIDVLRRNLQQSVA